MPSWQVREVVLLLVLLLALALVPLAPVVLPDADAGVRRAEIDPDGGAVNLGHGALTGEVSERRCTSVRSATGKVTAKPSGRGFFSTRKRQFFI